MSVREAIQRCTTLLKVSGNRVGVMVRRDGAQDIAKDATNNLRTKFTVETFGIRNLGLLNQIKSRFFTDLSLKWRAGLLGTDPVKQHVDIGLLLASAISRAGRSSGQLQSLQWPRSRISVI
jgi:hypothetical protein